MGLSEAALAFYRDYCTRHKRMEGAAAAAEELLGDALRDLPVEIHLISARAKGPTSLLKKLREKEYPDPANELTDQVAARVITYYEDHIEAVVTRLSEKFEVMPGESNDLAARLPLQAFGYRSHHLVVRADLDDLAGTQAQALKGLWFEIQIRSALAHPWDEIEHETVYKSGAKLSDEMIKRFARVSATLTGADEEFVRLREELDALTSQYAAAYADDDDFDERLDSLRLMAALEAFCPQGRSFRLAKQEGTSLPAHIEATCLEALEESGVSSAFELRERLADPRCRDAVESYAALARVLPNEVSHFATCVLAAGCMDATGFPDQFPDLLTDELLVRALEPESTEESALDEPPYVADDHEPYYASEFWEGHFGQPDGISIEYSHEPYAEEGYSPDPDREDEWLTEPVASGTTDELDWATPRGKKACASAILEHRRKGAAATPEEVAMMVEKFGAEWQPGQQWTLYVGELTELGL